ncbi:calcium/sodium antiporter [Ghiorsea bivora]|uniref:calcium/sodium antiporter n=1 Tax=Ghiorsea bivora TaxID=1485545 RepID=UPI0005718795|nr:calcium/sodium antiporter [Ghiorsea bivora]
MLTASIVIIVGLVLLVWSADRFVEGASGIAKNFQVSPLVIGLTIVSLCTSLPEMIVAGIAAMEGNNNLGIGNAIGSNIANIGLVLGVTALIAPLAIQSHILKREIPVLFLIMFLALVLFWDGELSQVDGIILSLGLFGFVFWLYKIGMKERDAVLEAEFQGVIPENMDMKTSVMWLIIGLLVLIASSRMMVWGAVEIATMLGVSDLVIGLTIIAIGTSLPELVASIASVLKNEAELAVGNIIGSNMFNILAVLMMPALLSPGKFDAPILERDIPIMFAFTVVLFLMAYGYKRAGRITRWEGGILLSSFSGYLYLLYLQS